MKKTIIFVLIAVILAKQIPALTINEIMYNPPEELGGRYNEWIELYNPTDNPINLTDWVVADPADHRLELSAEDTIQPKGYFILAKKPEDFSQYYDVACPIVKVAFSLTNGGEQILLKDNSGEIIDDVTYSDSWGADGDGRSLQFLNDSWCASTPTPNKENFCPSRPSFTLAHPSFVLNDGTIFLVGVNVLNYPDGLYDIKIDIKNENDERIGRIYNTNNGKWQSTTYYIKDASLVEEGKGVYIAYAKIDPGKDYTGTATMEGKLRLSGSSSYTQSDLYVFNVVSNIFSGEEEAEENQASGSSIEILDAQSSAEFGDIVKVKINVYRGDTAKYAAYAYIENDNGKKVSEKTTMHFKSKFTDYTLTIPIQLDLNCNEKYKDDDYIIVVEGIEKESTEEISLDGKSSDCGTTTSSSSSSGPELTSSRRSSPKFSYELSSKPYEIELGEYFVTEVRIANNDDIPHDVDIWSYVYRGPKSYSGDRELNKKKITLDSGETEIIELENKVDEAEPGNYNLKIRLKRDDQKTIKELTGQITLKSPPPAAINQSSPTSAEFLEIIDPDSPVKILKTPVEIYESKNIKVKELTLYFILVLAVLLDIALIIKR
ncbi:lamin tail domain-containing protein [Candidatus Woesearchaeota archaeon]|nr:lamin tail domain-containing protein [Candidatus Woesearchaeota archaeon]